MERGLIARLWSHVEFGLWSLRNPGRSFTDYYADTVIRSLANNERHPTLGPKLKLGSRKAAERKFNWLLNQGLRPSDTVVDYGCGTLRIGALLIEFLDPDCYIGLDIDQRILDLGRASLPEQLKDAKRPTLEIIAPDGLNRIVAMRPQWIFSNGVLQHVPPKHLHEYFSNLSRFIHAGATGFIMTRTASKAKTLSSKTWVHGLNQLQTTAMCYRLTFERVDRNSSIFKLRSQSL